MGSLSSRRRSEEGQRGASPPLPLGSPFLFLPTTLPANMTQRLVGAQLELQGNWSVVGKTGSVNRLLEE